MTRANLKEKKVHLSISIPPQLKAGLEEEADRECRSISTLITKVMQDYLEQTQKLNLEDNKKLD